jgi:hypothetical protein
VFEELRSSTKRHKAPAHDPLKESSDKSKFQEKAPKITEKRNGRSNKNT